MKLAEFEAWLEGFEEAIEGAPTPEQWAKVKSRLSEVEADVRVEPFDLSKIDYSKLTPHSTEPLRVYGPTWLENPVPGVPYTTCNATLQN